MRFTFVSLALLALAHSVVPVHGVPSNDADSLEVRGTGVVAGLVSTIQGLIQDLTGSLPSAQQIQQIQQTIQQILQGLQTNSLLPRADPTPSTSTTTASTSPSGGFVGNASSSTPPASSTFPARMRRQPAPAHVAVLD